MDGGGRTNGESVLLRFDVLSTFPHIKEKAGITDAMQMMSLTKPQRVTRVGTKRKTSLAV